MDQDGAIDCREHYAPSTKNGSDCGENRIVSNI